MSSEKIFCISSVDNTSVSIFWALWNTMQTMCWVFHTKCDLLVKEGFLLHFSQTCEFWSSKANWLLRFSLLSIILTDLLGNKRSWFVICDWWISIRFVHFCVARFAACDRNYDWQQRKTQLWRRLLNFRVCMFVKSAVNNNIQTNTEQNLHILLIHWKKWTFYKQTTNIKQQQQQVYFKLKVLLTN